MALSPAPGSLYPEQTVRVIIPPNVPAIYTERLYLRLLEPEDANDIFEYRSRQEVADFLWPKIPHKELKESEAVITKKIFKTPDASGAIGRRFTFAVIEKHDPSKKVIGTVGINALVPSPSIGYGIHPDLWGKGYMSEAVAGVVDAWWKLERIEPEDTGREIRPEGLFAGCNKANMGSLKVLLKNGFEIYQELELEGDSVALLEQKRPRNQH